MERNLITLEGFFDKRGGGDAFDLFLIHPVIRHDEPSSWYIDGMVEDIGINLSLGDELKEDQFVIQHMLVDKIKRAFVKAKERYEAGRPSIYLYWKVEMEYFTEDDTDVVFNILSYEGDKSLYPKSLMASQ